MKGLFGSETHTFRRPRVQYDTFRQHFHPFSLPKGARQNDVRIRGTLRQRNPHFSSPESAARHAWATLSRIFVARGCSTTHLGNTVAPFRRPRVKYDTFRRHFSPFSLPKGARQNDVRIRGTLRQRNPYFSSPKSKIRHAWVTLPRLFVARECSTTLSGNTSAPFRRSKVPHGTLRQQNPHFPSSGGWATSTLCRRGWSCRRGSTGERGLRSGHPRSACDGPLRCAQGRTFGGRG